MRLKISVLGIIGIFFICAMIPTTASAEAPWSEGQGWGYKWVANMSASEINTNNNLTFSGDAYGKAVYALYIKYAGIENGMYKFIYHGSLYMYGYMNGDINMGNYIMGNMSMHIKSTIKSVWINYDGYFLMERVTYDSGWFWDNSYDIYAVKSQYIHVYTKEPLDMYMNATGTNDIYNKSESIEYKLTGTYDITLNINYDNYIGYLPVNQSEDITILFEGATANYTGHEKIDLNGYIKYSATSDSMSGNYKFDLTNHSNRNLAGSEDIMWGMQTLNANIVNRPGMVENIPMASISMVGSYSFNGKAVYHDLGMIRFLNTLVVGHKATYDGSFYSTIYLFTLGSMEDDYFSLSPTETESQSATESDVKQVETSAPSEYGSLSQPSILDNLWIYIIIGMIAAVVVIVAVVIVAKKKKKPPMTPQNIAPVQQTQNVPQQPPPRNDDSLPWE